MRTRVPRAFKVFYSDRYTVPLPEGHRFPMGKYRMLRDRLVDEGVLDAAELCEAPLATREELLFAHTPGYVDAFLAGTIDPKMMRRIGLPWSEALVLRTLASVGGQIAAAEEAIASGFGANLAGGTHHAHADAGSGYCVFNDIAVSLLLLRGAERIRRAAVIDLDVHQGDGNSAILAKRHDVYVLSLHGAKNFPFVKVPSTVDVELPNGMGDDEYLDVLARALPPVFEFAPDIVYYQAGVDPLAEDTLGKLALTHAGLVERDRIVFSECARRGIPVSLSLGGGYAKPIERTIEAHVGTYRVAKRVF